MKILTLLIPAVSVSILLSACEEKKSQVTEKSTPATINRETTLLSAAIDAYTRNPGGAQAAHVDGAFAELDGEIAELDQRTTTVSGTERTEAKVKADNLRDYRDKERLRYAEAKARALTQSGKDEATNLGNKMEEGARKAGEGVKDAANAVTDGVGKAVDAVKEKLP